MSVLAESTQPQFSSPLSDTTSPDPQFPLRLSANGRYLVDSIGDPFMLKQFSAWCLMQAISEADAAAYLDSLKGGLQYVDGKRDQQRTVSDGRQSAVLARHLTIHDRMGFLDAK